MGRVTAAWTVVAAPGANNYNKNLILTSYSKNGIQVKMVEKATFTQGKERRTETTITTFFNL